jgi:rare lipoprotein A (peptidoglycan hydrolase)
VSYGRRSVQVTVNDRGPYVGARELDLSQGAAEYIGLTQAGVDYVEYSRTGGYDPRYETYPADAGYSNSSGTESYASGDVTGGGTYVVQAGDTMSGIAAQLGTSVEDLAAVNGISNPDLIYIGQTLYY